MKQLFGVSDNGNVNVNVNAVWQTLRGERGFEKKIGQSMETYLTLGRYLLCRARRFVSVVLSAVLETLGSNGLLEHLVKPRDKLRGAISSRASLFVKICINPTFGPSQGVRMELEMLGDWREVPE